MLLEVRSLTVRYGATVAVDRLDLHLAQGEVVALLGSNGAGKSSALRAIMGLVRPAGGSVRLAGRELTRLPTHRIARLGVSCVPEGRRVFADQTVLANLLIGAHALGSRDPQVKADLERVFHLFPVLRQRSEQLAGTLSGGEQQMLAIGRALMQRPRLLLLDEPSLGLAPRAAQEIYQTLRRLREEGLTALLVDQLAHFALSLADRACVLERGRAVLSGSAGEVRADARVIDAYLGARGKVS